MHNDADLIGLIDAIRDGLQSLPPTAVYDRKAGPNNPVAIFPVSDLRAGLLKDEQELGEKMGFQNRVSPFPAHLLAVDTHQSGCLCDLRYGCGFSGAELGSLTMTFSVVDGVSRDRPISALGCIWATDYGKMALPLTHYLSVA